MRGKVDPDQMLHSAASDLGLHSLLRPICPNIQGYYVFTTMEAESEGWAPVKPSLSPQ